MYVAKSDICKVFLFHLFRNGKFLKVCACMYTVVTACEVSLDDTVCNMYMYVCVCISESR